MILNECYDGILSTLCFDTFLALKNTSNMCLIAIFLSYDLAEILASKMYEMPYVNLPLVCSMFLCYLPFHMLIKKLSKKLYVIVYTSSAFC